MSPNPWSRSRSMRAQRIVRLGLYVLAAFSVLYAFSKLGGLQLSVFSASSAVPASAIVSLVKQKEEARVIEMVRNVEDRFNAKFKHDWVFLSEEDFVPDFEASVSAFTSGRAHFRTINRKLHWALPASIDRSRLRNALHNLDLLGVPYGGSTTYRLMCRFFSGFFMEYLPEYRYYMRIDPDVKLYCDVTDDVFSVMHKQQKKLGFTTSLHEVPHAAQDLSNAANQFMQANKQLVHANQWMDSWMRPWDECCHFWTNFEVGDLEFFRSDSYKRLFDHMETTGGFFYNRWGDAPFHALAASLFLDPHDVHWFGNIGSYHKPLVSCPTSQDERRKLRCTCPNDPALDKKEQNAIFTYSRDSCTPQFLNLTNSPFSQDWEKWADHTVLKQFASKNEL